MPDVTKEASTEFEKTPGYIKMREDNIEQISNLKSVVARLTQIKGEIDKLNQQLQNNSITQAQYDENIKPWISAFVRISSEMVTGDDVAKADLTLKQIKDREVYDYNDLLKGPAGCESLLNYDPTKPAKPYGFIGYARYPYPLPIMYDYNSYGTSSILPDPLYNPTSVNPKSMFVVPNPSRHGNRTVFNGKVGLAGVTFGATSSNGLFHSGGKVWEEYTNGATSSNGLFHSGGKVWEEYTNDFCEPIANILGVSHNCGNVWWVSGGGVTANSTNLYGPTIIYITDLVNIFDEANAETLERSLGIY
jgi:hypothetical protein